MSVIDDMYMEQEWTFTEWDCAPSWETFDAMAAAYMAFWIAFPECAVGPETVNTIKERALALGVLRPRGKP